MSAKPLVIELDLELGRRGLRALLAGSLMLWAATELQSESVTLTTYYPAPGGVYGQLLTTGSTALARDASTVKIGSSDATTGSAKLAVMNGSIGIGTTNPTAEVHVEGSINFGDVTANTTRGLMWHVDGSRYSNGLHNYGISREPGAWSYPYPDLAIDFHTGVKLKAHSGYGGVSIWEDYCDSGVDSCSTGGSGYGSEIARFRTNPYGNSYVLSRFTVGGSNNAEAVLDVRGDGVGIFRQPAARCRQINYALSSGAACLANEYITMQSGVMSRYAAGHSGGSGSALCCGCPFGSCPTLP